MSNPVSFAAVDNTALRYTIGNAVFKVVMKTPLAKKMDPMWILEVTGRRSGRTITTPVGLHDLDGRKVMLGGGRWKHNFADGHPFALHRAGTTVTGTGQLVTDLDTVADVYAGLFEKYTAQKDVKFAARNVGADLAGDRAPTREELRQALDGKGRAVVEVELDG